MFSDRMLPNSSTERQCYINININVSDNVSITNVVAFLNDKICIMPQNKKNSILCKH